MFETLIAALSFLVLFASIWLYRIAAGSVSITKLNMLSYSFYVLVAFAWCGVVIITINRPFLTYNPMDMQHLSIDTVTRLKVWSFIMWMFLALPLGAICANKVWQRIRRPIKFEDYSKRTIKGEEYDRAVFVAIVVSSAIILAALGGSLLTAGRLPMFDLLFGSDQEAALMLRRSFRLASNPLLDFVYSIFGPNTITWMCYVAYTKVLTRGDLKWRIVFVILALASAFLSLVGGTLAPIFTFLVGFMIVRVSIGRKPFKIHELAICTALLVVLFSSFKKVEGSFGEIAETAVVGRIVIAQLGGCYKVVEIFPRFVDFIGFKSTGYVFHEILGMPTSPSYGLVAMSYYLPEGVEAGTAGHMTTNFMGEAWANFGYIGVLLAPLWVGLVVQLTNQWVMNKSKTAITIAFYAMMTTWFSYQTDFISFYYPAGTLCFIAGVFIIIKASRFVAHR